MYLVLLRFWRARGLLSTSGGRELATVLGEWLRNAISPSWLRLLDSGEEDGKGDDPDMFSGLTRGGRRVEIEESVAEDVSVHKREDGNAATIGCGRECCEARLPRFTPEAPHTRRTSVGARCLASSPWSLQYPYACPLWASVTPHVCAL